MNFSFLNTTTHQQIALNAHHWVNNYDPVIPANPVLHSILKSGILRNVFTLGTLIIQLKQYQVTV